MLSRSAPKGSSREECNAANMADYPSLLTYVADLETKFNKLAAHGVWMTDSEQRHLLLRGLTSNYDNAKASILIYRNRDGDRADFATAVSLLEEYEDNLQAATNPPGSSVQPINREITMATFNTKPGKEKVNPVCFYFAKRGNCKRGATCNFRHVERATRSDRQDGLQAKRARASNRPRTGNCNNCGREGHWARECTAPKREQANVAVGEDWSRTTREFVGHGLNFKMPYAQDKWLVDSASTCLVANEEFNEFTDVGPAQVLITVGGDHQLQCKKVGSLTIYIRRTCSVARCADCSWFWRQYFEWPLS